MRKVFLLLTAFAFIASGDLQADDYIEKKPSAYTYKTIYDSIYQPIGSYADGSSLSYVANLLGTHQHNQSYPSASQFQALSQLATTNSHSEYVPYTGATSTVNLNSQHIVAGAGEINGTLDIGGTSIASGSISDSSGLIDFATTNVSGIGSISTDGGAFYSDGSGNVIISGTLNSGVTTVSNLYATNLYGKYDNTHAVATAAAAGFAPILSGAATDYLDGTGAYSVPASGGSAAHTHPLYVPFKDYSANQHVYVSNIGSQHLTASVFYDTLPADDSIIIDGRTNQRSINAAGMRLRHTPAAGTTSTKALSIDVQNNGEADTMGMSINYLADSVAIGDVNMAIDVNIDTSNSTGGDIGGLHVNKFGTGTVHSIGLDVGQGVDAIHQEAGSDVAAEKVWEWEAGPTWTDDTVAFGSAGTDVQIFTADNDIIYIGMAATFSHIEFDLAIVASGAGIKPTFGYSNGAGGWVTFSPNDATNGMRMSGVISWEVDNLTTWAADTVNGTGSKYWIKITRTANALTTPPTENLVQVASTTAYTWDDHGMITVDKVSANTFYGTLAVNQHASTYATIAQNQVVASNLGTHQHNVSYPSATQFQDLSQIATTNQHPNYASQSDFTTHQHNVSYPSTAQFQALSQIATTNTHSVATTTATGFAPILSNVATEFLNGTGAYSTPVGGVSIHSHSEYVPYTGASSTVNLGSQHFTAKSSEISEMVTGEETINYTAGSDTGQGLAINLSNNNYGVIVSKSGGASTGLYSSTTGSVGTYTNHRFGFFTNNSNDSWSVLTNGNFVSGNDGTGTQNIVTAGDITASNLYGKIDNTHAVATTASTGFAPILSNVATEFLNGTGIYSTPAGGPGASSSGSVVAVFDGGGSAIATGSVVWARIPNNATFTEWDITAFSTSPILVIDVCKSNFAGFDPNHSSHSNIDGTESPTLTNQQERQDTNLTSWITGVTAGSYIYFTVMSVDTATYAVVTVSYTK